MSMSKSHKYYSKKKKKEIRYKRNPYYTVLLTENCKIGKPAQLRKFEAVALFAMDVMQCD